MNFQHLGLPVIDYDKHCQFQFGSYVQVFKSRNPCNTTAARTLDCIYLHPITNTPTGGHEVLHIPTQWLLHRHGPIKAVPMPESVIRKVEELAKRQKMPHGLKIQSKFTEVTYPAEVDDDDDDQCCRRDANQTKVATVTTAGESESDSEDDSDSDTDSDSDDDELDDDIAAITSTTPGTFDNEATEPEPEEEVEEIPNAPHQPMRAQPARAAKQGITYSALNVEQHPVHDDCDPRVVGKYIHAMNHSFIQTYGLKAGLRKFKDRGMAAALKEMKQQHK